MFSEIILIHTYTSLHNTIVYTNVIHSAATSQLAPRALNVPWPKVQPLLPSSVSPVWPCPALDCNSDCQIKLFSAPRPKRTEGGVLSFHHSRALSFTSFHIERVIPKHPIHIDPLVNQKRGKLHVYATKKQPPPQNTDRHCRIGT
jgi:hypothetical protein